jgi:hypothetical protein
MKNLLVVYPRGESFRNFLYTDFTSKLKEFYNLYAFSVPASDPETLNLMKDFKRIFFFSGSEHVPYYVRLIRFLVNDIHDILFKNEAGYDRMQRKLKSRRGRLTYLPLWIYYKILHAISCKFVLNSCESLLSFISPWRGTLFYKDVLSTLKIDYIFSTSHIHNQISWNLLFAAKRLNIPLIGFVFSWDNLTSQGRIFPKYNYILVWNSRIEDLLHKMYHYYNKRNTYVVGSPQFDMHFMEELYISREEYCYLTGLDYNKSFFLYSTSMPYHTPLEEIIVENIAVFLSQNFPECQLLLRISPKDNTGRFEYLRKYSNIVFQKTFWSSDFFTPLPYDSKLWVNTLRFADFGINVASTVTLELAMFNKPVINVAYTPEGNILDYLYEKYYLFDHYRPIVNSNAIYIAKSEIDLFSHISELINGFDFMSQNRIDLINNFFEGRIGTSIDLIRDSILNITVQNHV